MKDFSLTKESKDFLQALVHTSLESPLNGLGQVVGKISGAQLPKLEIVGPVEKPSLGAMLGTVSGIVVDYYLLSKLAQGTLGNFGGTGAAGESLRAGIVGGVFTGLMQGT
ncbi:MAG: hypothetical protein K2X29_07900, partial [Candidatus Obscuribacterales bacterium]|nr:hypothetical protein [Candidatus Obscuribacterales bacterium]